MYLDYRNSAYSLAELKACLNFGMNKKFNVDTFPFRSVEPCHSHDCGQIQMVDLLIGAIGYKKNGCDISRNASPAKRELLEYITKKSSLSDITANTPASRTKFNIWNFRLQTNFAPQIK